MARFAAKRGNLEEVLRLLAEGEDKDSRGEVYLSLLLHF